jgi:hypothetical protein
VAKLTQGERALMELSAQFCAYRIFRRFLKRVKIDDPDKCWEFKGSTNPWGYVYFEWPEKGINYAHVVSYRLFVGHIPKRHGRKKLFVLHKCDNPPCVNPFHLWLGTKKQNSEDMVSKGRSHHPNHKGENSLVAKLTQDEVNMIKELFATGKYHKQSKTLSKRFGVSPSQISRIVNAKSWVQ